MDFIDLRTFLIILHLFGVALGAGGAYMSDGMFFSSIKDEKFSKTELRFLKLGSKFVWIGLLLLVLSGIGLFLTDPVKYMESTKFLSKMSIVAIIIANGIFFHLSHIPHLSRHEDTHFPSSDEFGRKRGLLLASGVVSMVSWSFALVLGALKSVPYPYWIIMLVYLGVVSIGVALSQLLKGYILPDHVKK